MQSLLTTAAWELVVNAGQRMGSNQARLTTLWNTERFILLDDSA